MENVICRLNCPDKSPVNSDVDAMSAEMDNINVHSYPNVNLAKDKDKRFSYPTNKVAIDRPKTRFANIIHT